MTRHGNVVGLLHGLHDEGCDGTEYSACRPIVVHDSEMNPPASIEVVFMAWCGDCGAADWEAV